MIPVGLCQCGCGEQTNRVKETDRRRGLKRGDFQRYINGHCRRVPIEQRFWEKVDKRTDGCWVWTGTRIKGKYGMTSINRVFTLAHRKSWEMANGPIPEGLQVLHKCDNPPCVNPAHLFLGTASDNMNDMHKKQRHPRKRGEDSPLAKLKQSEVEKIRLDTRKQKEIAADYGVSPQLVSAIKNNKVWKRETV